MPKIRHTAFALLLFSCLPATAETCPLAGETPMLVARLYFGGDDPVRGRKIPDKDWQAFLADTVTPRFPDGFTVLNAAGQWRDTKSRAIIHEDSHVVEIAGGDTPGMRSGIEAIAQAYRGRFHQQAVGIVTTRACAKF